MGPGREPGAHAHERKGRDADSERPNGRDLGFFEGPILTPEGDLGVTSISLGPLCTFDDDGVACELAKAEACVNGLTIDAKGQLYGTHIWATHPVPEWEDQHRRHQ